MLIRPGIYFVIHSPSNFLAVKASNIFKFLGVMLVLAIAVFFSNEAAAMVQDVGVHDLVIASPTYATVTLTALSNLNGSSEGEENPGGTRKLYVILARHIEGIWPKKADVVDGQIINLPDVVDGAGFAEYDFPDGTFSLTDSQDGDPGFQSYKQATSFMLAGFGAKKAAEVKKHLNSGSVVIGEMNDGSFAVAGSSDNAIYHKFSFSSGAKGNDKRGYTGKGEQDGFMWGILPLKPELVATLPLLPVTP
jgi:hypothetical protein